MSSTWEAVTVVFNAGWPHPGNMGNQRLSLLVNNVLAGCALVLTALGSELMCHWALCSTALSYSHKSTGCTGQVLLCNLAVPQELLLVEGFSL